MSLAWLKADVVLGSIGKFAAAALLVASFGITGCGSDPPKAGVAKGCTLNSDCNGGLVCSFGLCHQECEKTTDCPASQRCVKTDKSNVCQLNDEAQCHFNTDCSDPLICAIDRQCRNQCNGDKDCLAGQTCANSVCAEPHEVDSSGDLKGAVGAGGDNSGGNSSGGTSGSGGTTPGMGGEGGAPEMCTPGGDCVPDGMPCQLGVVTCDGGVQGCMAMGNADDGTDCGTDQVCSGGACVDCKVGGACTDPDHPDNTCIAGVLSCANGPDCMLSNVKAGTGCGTDQVCDGNGACAACKVDDPCDPPGQACKNGKWACSKGPVCNATTNKDAGTSCDTDKVCDSGASCVSCVQDGVCTPEGQECHVGKQDCKTGPNCVDTFASAMDGTSCTGFAAYNFCQSGSCTACNNSIACVPTNVCHKGTLNCATQPPTCNDTMANADDGFPCGDNQSCISGSCVTNDRVLSITTGPVADTAIDNLFAGVTVHLVDANNKAVQGAAITVVPTSGAYAAATGQTNASGNAQVTGRVGRAIGKYTYTVSAPGAAPIKFDVNAIATAAKNIFTVVNVNHTSAYATVPGAGTVSQLYQEARAVVAATDGTLYLASYCQVFKLSPEGELTTFAGDEKNLGCQYNNNDASGAATTVGLYYPQALALDEANGYLYIADSNARVWQVALTTDPPSILRYAGLSTASNAQPWGDTGPSDAAYLNPSNIAVAPNGDLYISDANSARIRKVDFNTGIINTVLVNKSCNQNGPLELYSCGGYGDPCSMAWDSGGKLFISAYMCGGGNSYFRGVARVEQDGSLSLVAGNDGPVTPAEGGVATGAAFSYSPYITFDKAGNLFLATRYDQRVRRIDAVTSKITTVAGTGTAGVLAGDYAAGNAAVVNNPTTISFDGAGNLYFADSANYAIRTVYGIGATTTPTAKLAKVSGDAQSVKRDAAFGAVLVKLTDSNNAAISGVNVNWVRKETGSGLGATGALTIQGKTNASGNSSQTGRVGLATGDYHFEASFTDIHGTPVTGSPQTFTVTAVDPDAGTIFPVMNYVHTNGTGGYPGPATFAKLQQYALAITAASDGTIYAADQCAIYAITPRGEVSVFAGTPQSCGFAGDSGPAVGAKLYYPEDMALDETNGILYIADNQNSRIRQVDMNTGNIDTFAGGGSVNAAPWGDGGQAVDANIGSTTSVALAPDGKVYINDYSHNYLRVVDPTTGVITKWFTPSYTGVGGAGCVANVPSLYYPTNYGTIRFKANGDAYIFGYICQGTNDTTATYGILLKTGGTFTRIGGLSGGSANDNIQATAAGFPSDMSDMRIDGNGDLVLDWYSQHKIRKIFMSGGSVGQITTIAGDGTAGYSLASDVSAEPGAYVAATGVRVYNPWKLGLWPGGHVLIADENNYAIRMIW